jgi:predicted unusual protein kinase regulating ubiquinone biosynthesis (AarF/ABC1/UbiB family)
VLKVQYPELAEVIDDDFDAVVRMLTMARWLRAGRDLDDWLEDMRRQLHNEIDYPREAAMTRDAALSVSRRIRPCADYVFRRCTRRLLRRHGAGACVHRGDIA